MKKVLSLLLAVTAVFSLSVPAFAAENVPEKAYAIVVNGQTLDLGDLPVSPYQEGSTVMVPLRKIGEALGYKVDWNAETNAITIDDDYIQKATLFAGSAAVVFEGRLQVINMSREIENAAATVIHAGYTYVPLEFFEEFFNDTLIDGTSITIDTSMCEINAA